MVKHGPESIEELIKLGTAFTREKSESGEMALDLAMEGGHSAGVSYTRETSPAKRLKRPCFTL